MTEQFIELSPQEKQEKLPYFSMDVLPENSEFIQAIKSDSLFYEKANAVDTLLQELAQYDVHRIDGHETPSLIEHIKNVTRLGLQFAHWLVIQKGYRCADEAKMMRSLFWGLYIHDIGKRKVPAYIFQKHHLNEEERCQLRNHPDYGFNILNQNFPRLFGENETDIMRFHHERYDGTGYPDGLIARQIPYFARIAGIVDTFQGGLEERGYKTPMPIEQVITQMYLETGTHFDPILFRYFIKMIRETEIISPAKYQRSYQHYRKAVENEARNGTTLATDTMQTRNSHGERHT